MSEHADKSKATGTGLTTAQSGSDRSLKSAAQSSVPFSDQRPERHQHDTIQKAADKYAAAKASPIIQKKENKTGLPDTLKQGVESLSGLAMDDVKVHYNSPAPAQLQAHAYAQGNHIHVAPGQEKHLPHEAWHVVQQKQGRVKPNRQLKSWNLNDDEQLEQEADTMGDQAMQLKAFSPALSDPPTETPISTSPATPVQRIPDDALKQYAEGGRKHDTQILIAIRRLLKNLPQISAAPFRLTDRRRTKTVNGRKVRRVPRFDNGKHVKRRILNLVRNLNQMKYSNTELTQFVRQWNQGLKMSSPYYIPLSLVKEKVIANNDAPHGLPMDLETGQQHGKKSHDIDGKAANYLRGWKDRPLRDKKMNPTLKLMRMLDQGVLEEDLPEDFWVALKLFFVHTAEFEPDENQGRDMNEVGEGTYYRSSENSVKDHHRDVLIEHLKKLPALKGKFAQKTVRPLNIKLLHTLAEKGAISSNMEQGKIHVENLGKTDQEKMFVALYTSSQASKTGPLGLYSNAIKSMREASRIQRGGTVPNVQEQLVGKEKEHLGGLVDPELLKSSGEDNYHDAMLKDRGQLVRDISDWINSDPNCQRAQITAIQSPEHASIIIHHPGHNHHNEAEWREAFMQRFKTAARQFKAGPKKDQGYDTHLTRRGSFGFLYPTASSVGGPVRIWPGMTPPLIFKQIMQQTLLAVSHLKLNGQQLLLTKGINTQDKDNHQKPIHIETLKSAVRFAMAAINGASHRPVNAERMYQWLITRLTKNLIKAQFLLQKGTEGFQDSKSLENHYLKSTLVIENLMEYSFLFTAMTMRGRDKQPDPYEAHAKSKLLPPTGQSGQGGQKKDLKAFYLDSGMQAIISANLLAKGYVEKTQPLRHSSLQVRDIHSYFEFPMVSKSKLKLEPFNEKTQHAPDIIAADLNPVFTTPGNVMSHEQELQHYQESKTGTKTIPIIDITNSTLNKAAALNLGQGYENYIIVESLSKHQQLGSDKYTMGRLVAVGNDQFIKTAEEIVGAIAAHAHDPLWMAHRRYMDEVFYGTGKVSDQGSNDKSNPKHSLSFILNQQSSGFNFSGFQFPPKKKTHEETRKNEDQGKLTALDGREFQRIERGIVDHQGRGDSCGFLTLNITREQLHQDLVTAIDNNHGYLARILELIGDEVHNAMISNQQPRLSPQRKMTLIQLYKQVNTAESKRANRIQEAKEALIRANAIQVGQQMNVQEALHFLQPYKQKPNGARLIQQITEAAQSLQQHQQQLHQYLTDPLFAKEFLGYNLLDNQRLSTNIARAWALATNKELHVWTHTGGFFSTTIAEISPDDVLQGGPVIHMLHTWNRTHFQELLPL